MVVVAINEIGSGERRSLLWFARELSKLYLILCMYNYLYIYINCILLKGRYYVLILPIMYNNLSLPTCIFAGSL